MIYKFNGLKIYLPELVAKCTVHEQKRYVVEIFKCFLIPHTLL